MLSNRSANKASRRTGSCNNSLGFTSAYSLRTNILPCSPTHSISLSLDILPSSASACSTSVLNNEAITILRGDRFVSVAMRRAICLPTRPAPPKIRKHSFWGNFAPPRSDGLDGSHYPSSNQYYNPVKHAVKERAGDHKGPPHSTPPPSPLREE